jgi:CheY-like chemotaxis protein
MISTPPKRPHILLVDDEPDIHEVTKFTLKSVRHNGSRPKFLSAFSGKEAVELMRENPQVAVILLDVVMETAHAGLDACRMIRNEVKNPFVRIILRTGQPGSAPERDTIDNYDIDGYLSKAELTANRLFASSRSAIRTWYQLIELERHRRFLSVINDSTTSLNSYDDLSQTLNQILEAISSLCPSELIVLNLSTFDHDGTPQMYNLRLSSQLDSIQSEIQTSVNISQISGDMQLLSRTEPTEFEGGYFLPLSLARELGYGWIFLNKVKPDSLTCIALSFLIKYISNLLYFFVV